MSPVRFHPTAIFWWLISLGRTGRGHAGGLLHIWVWWEGFERWRHHVRPLRPGGAFHYSLSDYGGKLLVLPDGGELRRGDRVLELHLDNHALSRDARAANWSPWDVVEDAREDMRVLARVIASGDLSEVRAVHGMSLFASGLRRLGFRVTRLPDSTMTRLARFYFVGLLAIYHPMGWRGAARARARGWPAEAWISTPALLGRYLA
jgi:hypothetical protein